MEGYRKFCEEEEEENDFCYGGSLQQFDIAVRQ